MRSTRKLRSVVCPYCGYHGNPSKPVEATLATVLLPNLVAFFGAGLTLLVVMFACVAVGTLTMPTVIGPIICFGLAIFGGPFLAALTFASLQIWAFRRFFGINKAKLNECPSCARQGLVSSASVDGQLYIRSRLMSQPDLRQCDCGYYGRFITPERLTAGATFIRFLGASALLIWLLLGTSCTVLPLVASALRGAKRVPPVGSAPVPGPEAAKVAPAGRAGHAQKNLPSARRVPAPDPLNGITAGVGQTWLLAFALTLVVPFWLLLKTVRRLAEARRAFDQCPSCQRRYAIVSALK